MKHKRARAQSLVEFALLLPVLLALIFGLIDAALIFQGYLTVAHAAREGARFAVVYNPNQGECLNRNIDGSPVLEPYPNCPEAYAENPVESDANYYARRSLLIKRESLAAVRGLRTTTVCEGADSNSCIAAHNNEPGLLGVRIWGFQAFDAPEQIDMPGLRGLPVRVQVIHNVPLVVFGTILPNAHVQVRSAASYINEGVQVGYGNQPPPTFAPLPPPVPPGTAVPTNTPGPTPTTGPTPTATPIPVYNITLNFETAVNTLPDERAHVITALVKDETGANVAGARVTFETDFGAFHYSGIGMPSVIVSTDSNGIARTVLYANQPGVSNITAWLNYNGDGDVDANEPSDTAVKTWDVTGPYLVVSDHNPRPADWIAVSVMDHDPAFAPFSLWWCPTLVTSTQVIEQLAYPVTVDSITWDYEDLAVQVPIGVSGRYRIESHTGDGGASACGNSGTLIAWSGELEMLAVPPDLAIAGITVMSDTGIILGTPITIQVEVINNAPIAVDSAPSDVDTYLDLSSAPSLMQLGEDKQWIGNLAAFESTVATTTVTLYDYQPHDVWFQVDTTNYVDEGDTGGEDNNVFGPYTLSASCTADSTPYGDRFDDSAVAGKWASTGIPSSVGGNVSESGEYLRINAYGRSTWGGDDNMYYVYQSISGDFDARLRVVSGPSCSGWAKVGLMVRNSTNANSRYVALMRTRDHGLQFAYRPTDGGGATRAANDTGSIAMPVWVRLVHTGNTFDYYYSTVAEPSENGWTHAASVSVDMDNTLIGIGHAPYGTCSNRVSELDEFVVCQSSGTGPGGEIFPPGLTQCSQLLSVTGFEGNPETVFTYWNGGDANGLVGAYQRTSTQFRLGSFSLRMHASNGFIPCASSELQPYLYQDVVIPTEIYTFSTFNVSGYYFVDRSTLECSAGTVSDADDRLTLNMYNGATPLLADQPVIDGGSPSGTWYPIDIALSDAMADITTYAGQTVRLQWDGYNDTDIDGTFFYLDDLNAEVCSSWPIPPDEPGTASIGGTVKTYGQNNIPVILPGADVWAYSQGGEILHTRSIHDGTYHFYNIPAGTYIIYAEAWMSGQLRTASTQVTVALGERNYNINLLLQ